MNIYSWHTHPLSSTHAVLFLMFNSLQRLSCYECWYFCVTCLLVHNYILLFCLFTCDSISVQQLESTLLFSLYFNCYCPTLYFIQHTAFLMLGHPVYFMRVCHFSRLDDLILEAIRKLNEPSGSNKAAVAAYIEVCGYQFIVCALVLFCVLFNLLTSAVLLFIFWWLLSVMGIVSSFCMKHLCWFFANLSNPLLPFLLWTDLT